MAQIWNPSIYGILGYAIAGVLLIACRLRGGRYYAHAALLVAFSQAELLLGVRWWGVLLALFVPVFFIIESSRRTRDESLTAVVNFTPFLFFCYKYLIANESYWNELAMLFVGMCLFNAVLALRERRYDLTMVMLVVGLMYYLYWLPAVVIVLLFFYVSLAVVSYFRGKYE